MYSLMIIGADHLGKIPEKLEEMGYKKIAHINGRKNQMVKLKIPSNIDVILVLTDYINHNLTAVIKNKAKELGIPICYAKRSWCSIHRKLIDHKNTDLIPV